MFVAILDWLGQADASAALAKLTLRAGLAAAVSFLVTLLTGPRLIALLRRHFREPIVGPSPAEELVCLNIDWFKVAPRI